MVLYYRQVLTRREWCLSDVVRRSACQEHTCTQGPWLQPIYTTTLSNTMLVIQNNIVHNELAWRQHRDTIRLAK